MLIICLSTFAPSFHFFDLIKKKKQLIINHVLGRIDFTRDYCQASIIKITILRKLWLHIHYGILLSH